jgi:DNA-directed RNA polymerase omega subunit
VQDLKDKADSLYRLVIVAARRANQLTKAEAHTLGGSRSKKSTMVALQEIVDGKLGYVTGKDDEDDFE